MCKQPAWLQIRWLTLLSLLTGIIAMHHTPLYTHTHTVYRHQAVTVTCISREDFNLILNFQNSITGLSVEMKEGWWWWCFWTRLMQNLFNSLTSSSWCRNHRGLCCERGWLDGFGEREKWTYPKEPDITQHAISGRAKRRAGESTETDRIAAGE